MYFVISLLPLDTSLLLVELSSIIPVNLSTRSSLKHVDDTVKKALNHYLQYNDTIPPLFFSYYFYLLLGTVIIIAEGITQSILFTYVSDICSTSSSE